MRRFRLGGITMLAMLMLAVVGCKQEDLYQGNKTDKEVNDFDFSTVVTPTVNVNYTNLGFGTAKAPVFFELFTENPVTTNEEGVPVLRENLKPIYVGFTEQNASWSGQVEIPSYAKKIYAYTPSALATTVMEAEVADGSITLTDAVTATRTATRATVRQNLYTNAVTDCGWKEWLGDYSKTAMDESATDYNKLSGGMSYANVLEDGVRDILFVSAADAADLLSRHQEVIEISHACPEKYRTSKDLTITENAAVAVTHLGSNTCWSNSIAYYYYREGEEPKSRDDIHPILLIPNTQDGLYVKGAKSTYSVCNNAKGIERGTTIQLYFFGYGDDMKIENKTRTFPKGTKIGLLLKSHAWNDGNGARCSAKSASKAVSPNDDINDSQDHFTSTTPGLNSTMKFTTGSGAAMYTPDGKRVIISFEDHKDDENYSDVVLTLTTSPEASFTDVTTVSDCETTKSVRKGVYAFEDLWPATGDYDMNDVVVQASTTKTTARDYTTVTETKDGVKTVKQIYSSNSYLKSESFTFQVGQNYAKNNNGLAFTWIPGATNSLDMIESATISVDGGAEKPITSLNSVFYLTNNVKNVIGKDIVVKLTYKKESYTENAGYSGQYVAASKISNLKTFIYRSEGESDWEVHVPYEAPTARANTAYFGQGDDLTDLKRKTYYMRAGNYPFAFYLSGATFSDMAPLLNSENESKAIDKIYPNFLEWSTSRGTKCKDWYKISTEEE